MEGSAPAEKLPYELRQNAKTVTKTARDRIYGAVDAQKANAAGQAKSVADALKSTAGEMQGAPAWLQSAVKEGAQAIQRLADSLENRDARQLATDVKTLARDNPATILGACALAGFAAARVLKAGGQTTEVEFTPDFSTDQTYEAINSDPYLQSASGTQTAFGGMDEGNSSGAQGRTLP
jgi:hypothetical protein